MARYAPYPRHTQRMLSLTVFADNRLRPNGNASSECCTVPGDVSACCTNLVRRNRALIKSSLFKKPLR